MLFIVTALADFLAMSLSLWLAAYLLARGYTSRVTWRAVIILVALTGNFFSAYINLHHPVAGSSIWRATCLTLALVVWHDLVAGLVPGTAGRRRLKVWAVYALGVLNVGLLWWAGDLYPGIRGSFLWTPQVKPALIYIWYAAFLVLVLAAIFYDFVLLRRAGLAPHHRFFFWATCLAAATVLGFLLQTVPGVPALPRVLQDALLLAAVGLFGFAVARHQAMVERRTTVQDFPLSGLTVLGLASLYAALATQRSFQPEEVAFITVLAVLTHSSVDLVREFLDRLLHRQDGVLRQRLRRLARNVGGEDTLRSSLRRSLAILCHRWRSSGGLIALRSGDAYEVVVSRHSRPVGTRLALAERDDLFRPDEPDSERIVWFAPAHAAGELVAVLGLGRPRGARRDYTERELDALAEAADWLGLMVLTHQRQQAARAQLASLADETQAREVGLQAGAEDLLTVLQAEPEPDLVNAVEHALRHLDDYSALDSSMLVGRLGIRSASHIERGKAVRQRLLQALECLRPAGPRPREPLPRAWHGYAALYDAYVEDVPNREIIQRLYIGEGTFNRTRRKALRSLTRALVEMGHN
jgi:hypothetical protein